MTVPMFSYKEVFEEKEKFRYKEFLWELGEHIRFEDDIWVCDKRVRSGSEPKNYHCIYFSKVSQKYKEIVKYYAILRILQGDTIRTVRGRVTRLIPYLNFMEETDEENLLGCNVIKASDFMDCLNHAGYAENTKKGIWQEIPAFIRTMDGFHGIKSQNPFSINPYVGIQKLDYKYIPENVADRLDRIFKEEEVELHLKCIYWLLRLIPSRISEILGMKLDCIKYYSNHYVVFIPTWKQNGGHIEPLLRSIHLEKEGMAGYLLDLLQQQKEAALRLQSRLPDKKRGFLFAYQRVLHYKKGGKSEKGVVNIMQISGVSYQLRRICEIYRVLDENGGIYNLTSHQFRHNGITDRLAAGFTLEQIADMTGHHGNAMIWNAYSHLDLKPETIVEKQKYILAESAETEQGYVLFGGRILNMGDALEKRLLKNIRAQKVPGGICGDVTGCRSDMWNCLNCGMFIVDAGQLGYFEEGMRKWKEKAERFSDMPMVRDNAEKHADQFRRIIERIRLEEQTDEKNTKRIAGAAGTDTKGDSEYGTPCNQ